MGARRPAKRKGSHTGIVVGAAAAVAAALILGIAVFSGQSEKVKPAAKATQPTGAAPVEAAKPSRGPDTPAATPIASTEPEATAAPARPVEPAASDRTSWPNDTSALGINLSGVIDWASEVAFEDIFLRCRPWISQEEGKPWGKGDPLELDAKGWVKRLKPGQRAEAFMLTGQSHYPVGRSPSARSSSSATARSRSSGSWTG
jgi:hypothetical protein